MSAVYTSLYCVGCGWTKQESLAHEEHMIQLGRSQTPRELEGNGNTGFCLAVQNRTSFSVWETPTSGLIQTVARARPRARASNGALATSPQARRGVRSSGNQKLESCCSHSGKGTAATCRVRQRWQETSLCGDSPTARCWALWLCGWQARFLSPARDSENSVSFNKFLFRLN